jgi:hypothetical protein
VTLDQAIAKLPWDAAKQGPLVAVCALRIAHGATLDDLERKTMTVGGLTAVVPKEMVTVNSRFTTAPNMYEGMPQEAKVMYLMRSLTPSQWTKANAGGLSLGDCQGEQAAVMDSILPKPFRYSMGTISEGGGITNPSGPKEMLTLSEADRAKVKLRLIRHLEIQISLENDGGWTATSIDDDVKNGMKMPYLPTSSDEEFGQKILVRGPNMPRKSQLNVADTRLGAAIPMVAGESVKQLLERITAATRVKFVADPHFANMRMVEKGTTAVARDLLGAVSLGVFGTYRRLCDTYILTNDLEGMGAHQARLSVWEDALKKVVDERTNQWRAEVSKNEGFRRIGFKSPMYDGLSQAEMENLEKNDSPRNQPAFIPIGQASKPVADAVKNWKLGNKIDKEKVGVSSSVRYQIVLPNGQRAWWQGWLGNGDQFKQKPYVWAPSNPAPVKLPFDGSKGIESLVLHADTPAEARKMVGRVAKAGVPELLLETSSPSALAAAVEEGKAKSVKVGLAVRPWDLSLGGESRSADPDRTVTGDRGRSLDMQKANIAPWRWFWQDISSFEPPTRESIAPRDPVTARHIASTMAVASTPGIGRVVLLDLYSPGYGKEDSRISGSYFYSSALDGFLAQGYSDTLRSAFLASDQADPLDLTTDMMDLQVRIDPAWCDSPGVSEGYGKWQAAKGKWSLERAQQLVRALPGRTLWMPGAPPQNHMPPLAAVSLYRWSGAGELPEAPQDFGGGPVPEAAVAQVYTIVDETDLPQRNRVADRLRKAMAKAAKPIVLDFSSVPAARLDVVLGRWVAGG